MQRDGFVLKRDLVLHDTFFLSNPALFLATVSHNVFFVQ